MHMKQRKTFCYEVKTYNTLIKIHVPYRCPEFQMEEACQSCYPLIAPNHNTTLTLI